jgi:hypothetical protein
MQIEAIRIAIKKFEATHKYTTEVKADELAVLKAMTAQVVLHQAGEFDRLRVELSAKYAGNAPVREYLRHIAYSYVLDLEEYAQDLLTKLHGGALNVVA